MIDEVLNEIRKIAFVEKEGKITPVLGKNYDSFEFNISNFSQISKNSKFKSIAFIDGGNSPIISSPAFSLSLIRTSCVIFENKKRRKSILNEFFCLAKSIVKNKDVKFELSFYSSKKMEKIEKLEFLDSDETLKNGVNNAQISSASNAARRILELILAKKISDEKSADLILIDGNLQETFTHEDKFMKMLQESCEKSGAVLCALSKTSSVLASSAVSFSNFLMSQKKGSWIYGPIAKNLSESHKGEIFFAKMNENSKNAFRFEIFENQRENLADSISAIKNYCNDPIFMGYPYGLIEADRIARVSNVQVQSLRAKVVLKLGKDIEQELNSLNAHEILDRISF